MATRAHTLILNNRVDARRIPLWVDILALAKMRVVSLVVFTSFVLYAIAPSDRSFLACLGCCLVVGLGAAGAACLNQWYEVDIDVEMTRTRNRPLAAGRLFAEDALRHGLSLSVLSVVLMACIANVTAAALLAAAILCYVVVYTMWLKRRTPYNIVIGGLAGAFPPLIGWVAATGHIGTLPVMMFLVIAAWTPAHFWALALYMRNDYANAGIPMMPVVAGIVATRLQILFYALATAGLAVAVWMMGLAGDLYGVGALVLSALFVGLAVRVLVSRRTLPSKMRAERRLFGFSIFYLFALFGLLFLDSLAVA